MAFLITIGVILAYVLIIVGAFVFSGACIMWLTNFVAFAFGLAYRMTLIQGIGVSMVISFLQGVFLANGRKKS